MNRLSLLAACIASLASAGCGGGSTESAVQTPGADKTAKTEMLEAGAAIMQNNGPLEALIAYMGGFHFYSGNMRGQMEAHQNCALLNEEVTQCVIYDDNTKAAKLMGVEYIVSAKLFAQLSVKEEHLKHSNVREIRSGRHIDPGIPDTGRASGRNDGCGKRQAS